MGLAYGVHTEIDRVGHLVLDSIRINSIADGVVGANTAYNEHNNKMCCHNPGQIERKRVQMVGQRVEQVFREF